MLYTWRCALNGQVPAPARAEQAGSIHNRTMFHTGEKGFSFPEVLVAMTVFATVGVTFISSLGTGYKVLSTSDQRTTAQSLARAQMDKVNNAPYDGTAPYSYDSYAITGVPAGYTVNIAVALVDPQTGSTSATDLGIQKITVTVTCQAHSPPEVVKLEAYKR